MLFGDDKREPMSDQELKEQAAREDFLRAQAAIKQEQYEDESLEAKLKAKMAEEQAIAAAQAKAAGVDYEAAAQAARLAVQSWTADIPRSSLIMTPIALPAAPTATPQQNAPSESDWSAIDKKLAAQTTGREAFVPTTEKGEQARAYAQDPRADAMHAGAPVAKAEAPAPAMPAKNFPPPTFPSNTPVATAAPEPSTVGSSRGAGWGWLLALGFAAWKLRK
ncbi:MAG: hypothetical protein KA310_03535 [Pseudomonadales bacterium]|nr:hypothetical protein [Pseudomonadales bacterium]